MRGKLFLALGILTIIAGAIAMGFGLGHFVGRTQAEKDYSFHFERDCEVQRFYIEEGYIELSGNDDTLTITISSKGE